MGFKSVAWPCIFRGNAVRKDPENNVRFLFRKASSLY
jgi:hypothetical protein